MNINMKKYNTMRAALAYEDILQEGVVIIRVPPKLFALKRESDADMLEAAKEILEHPNLHKGITPLDVIQSFDSKDESLILYVMVCFAVALKEEWLTYSTIIHKYILNTKNPYAVEYAEDMQARFLK